MWRPAENSPRNVVNRKGLTNLRGEPNAGAADRVVRRLECRIPVQLGHGRTCRCRPCGPCRPTFRRLGLPDRIRNNSNRFCRTLRNTEPSRQANTAQRGTVRHRCAARQARGERADRATTNSSMTTSNDPIAPSPRPAKKRAREAGNDRGFWLCNPRSVALILTGARP